MATVSAPHCRDARGMTGSRQPVVHRSANPATFQRRLAMALVPRDQQKDPVPSGNRLL
jgi:hypothetical protein